MFIEYHGQTLEVPRHVHKKDGTSKVVHDGDELDAAVAAGWLIDPNQQAVVLTDAASDFTVSATEGELADIAASEFLYAPIPDILDYHDGAPSGDDVDTEPAESDSPSDAPKRKPGRPKKGA